MSTAYRQAFDRLALSEESKERLAATLAEAIDEREAARAQGADGRAQTNGAHAAPAARTGRPRLFKKRWHFAAAAGLAGVLVAGGAGTAAAGGGLITVQGLIDDVFNGAPAATEVVDAIGRPIGAAASSNGVTITADAVVGDRWNYVVVFSISRDDGLPFDVQPSTGAAAGTLPLVFSGASTMHIDGVSGTAGGVYFYDADTSDNAIQMVQSLSSSTRNDAGVIGSTARVHLEGLCALDEESGELRPIAEGTWDLKFAMNYEDTTIDLPAGFEVDYNGLTAEVQAIALSPIGITVDYTAHDVMDWQDQGDGTMSDHNAAEMDRILNLPVLITLADGTVIDATDGSSSSHDNGNGTTSVHKGSVFETLANPDDVTSVTVGGREVWQR